MTPENAREDAVSQETGGKDGTCGRVKYFPRRAGGALWVGEDASESWTNGRIRLPVSSIDALLMAGWRRRQDAELRRWGGRGGVRAKRRSDGDGRGRGEKRAMSDAVA